MPIILQVNYAPSPTQPPQSREQCIAAAEAIAALPGLRWKVWIKDEASATRGGIYLFDDIESARAWGDMVLPKRLADAGGSNISIRYFEVNEEQSRVTRAPLDFEFEAA
jgi:hypothetical protein